MKIDTKRLLTVAVALVLLGLLAGCESDAVAPQDELPALTADDAAVQAGAVAYAVTEIGPKLMELTNTTKVVHDITWTGEHGLTGTVHIDYRDGPDGAPAASAAAAWAHLYTDAGAPVVYTAPDLGGQTAFVLDVTASLDHQADQATILAGSGGTMTSGEYVVTFGLAGIIMGSGGYPQQGGMTITAGAHTAEVNFNGTSTAYVLVDGTENWLVDLDTGLVTRPPV